MTAEPIVRLNELLHLVSPHVVGASVPLMTQALRNAAIEFCEKTRCWRYSGTFYVDQARDNILVPGYATVHEIEDASFEGEELTPTQYTAVDRSMRSGAVTGGQPRYISQVAAGKISVFPFAAGNVTVSVFLKPRADKHMQTSAQHAIVDAYDVIPQFMFQQHAMALANGAIAYLTAIPKQTFTDFGLARYHRSAFENAMTGQSSRRVRGQQRARIRTKPQWF